MNNSVTGNLGYVTAYKYAQLGGYTGTEEEFEEMLANVDNCIQYAERAEEALAATQDYAEQAETSAVEAFAGTPDGYRELVKQTARNENAIKAEGTARKLADNSLDDDIEVLRTRIDVLQNGISGEAPDDEELADIRVMTDGRTADSAGTAVREQVKNLIKVQMEEPSGADRRLNKLWVGITGETIEIPDMDDIAAIEDEIGTINTASAEDAGKALTAKTVENGVVTEWEYKDVAMQEELDAVDAKVESIRTATAADSGKALIAKTIRDGRVVEWEFGDIRNALGVVDKAITEAKLSDDLRDKTINKLEQEISDRTEKDNQHDTILSLMTARMDMFTSLPAGSTVGDAELMDLRVKADGTSSNSAGNAVREQISELQAGLERAQGRMYKTTADLKKDEALELGEVCQTAGFETVDDGGGTIYVIEEEPYIWGSVALDNGLYANFLDHMHVNAVALGCKAGGFDNGPVLNAIAEIKRAHENIYTAPLILHFPGGTFVMSPVLFDCPGIFIEGNIEPGEAHVPQTGCTCFAPAGDQEYIIQFGRDATNLYGPYYEWMYQSGGMKKIRFTCEKWDSPGGGLAHHYHVTKACLVLGRRCYNWFDKLMFRDVWGTCIYISASYELVFGHVYMYHILAPDYGALHFGYDIGNSRENKVSDNSAMYFDYLGMEAIVGDPIQFAGLNDTYNTMFNVISYEDYRLDDGSNPEESWGCPWTDTTWLPEGYTEPDVELGIIHFKTHCTMDNVTINTLNLQFISHRSYKMDSDGLVYTHDGIVLVDPDVFTWSLSIGVVDVHASTRGPLKPVISKSPYLGRTAHLYIGSLTTNDAFPDVYPDGYVRDYDVRLGRYGKSSANSRSLLANPLSPSYKSVFDSTVVERDGIAWSSMESLGAPSSPWDSGWIGRYQPLGKGCKDAYSWNRVCAIPPCRAVFPDSGADQSPIRIPIINDILYLRMKEDVEDSVIGAVISLTDNSRLLNFNLKAFPGTDWKWAKLDLSTYKHTGYVTFYMRGGTTNEALLDVFYWEQKVPEIPEIPTVYDDRKVLQKVDIFGSATSAAETINGITFVFDKDAGTVTLSGTATANASYRIDIPLTQDGVYYASANVTPEGSKTTYRMMVYDSTTWVQARDSNGNQFQSICADELNEFVKVPDQGLFLSFYVNNGVTIENAVFTPEIFKAVGTIDNRGSFDGTMALDVYDWIPEIPTIPTARRVLKDVDVLKGQEAVSQTVNGITFVMDVTTGVVTISGTSTAAASLTIPVGAFEGGTYYVSANVTPKGSTSTYRMMLRDTTTGVQPRDANGNQLKSLVADELNEFVMPDGDELSLVFYVDKDITIESASFTPVIYKSVGSIENIGTVGDAALDVYDWVPETSASAVTARSKTITMEECPKVFASNTAETITSNSVTFARDANGVVTANGTATGGAAHYFVDMAILKAGTYSLRCNVTPAGSTSTYRVLVWDTVTGHQVYAPSGSGFASVCADEMSDFVIPAMREGRYQLYFRVDSGATADNVTFTPEIYMKRGDYDHQTEDGSVMYDFYDSSVSGKALSQITWNAVGDSITHSGRYLNYIKKTLGISCTNLGVASSTIAVNTSNTDLQNGSFAERVLGLNGNAGYDDADIWTVYGGVNDVIYGSPLGALAAAGSTFDNTTVYGALQAIVENILGRRERPRLLLITPTHSKHDTADNGGATAAQVVQAFEDVGEYYGVPVVNMFKLGGLNAFINQHATHPATFDGLHPNPVGGAMIAAPIVHYMKMLLYDAL